MLKSSKCTSKLKTIKKPTSTVCTVLNKSNFSFKCTCPVKRHTQNFKMLVNMSSVNSIKEKEVQLCQLHYVFLANHLR